MEDGVEKRQRISEKIRASDRERFHKIQKKIDTVRERNNRVLRCVDPTEVGNKNEQKKINKEKVGKKRKGVLNDIFQWLYPTPRLVTSSLEICHSHVREACPSFGIVRARRRWNLHCG